MSDCPYNSFSDLQGPAGNGGTSALPGGLDTSALLTPKRSQIGGAV
jgi:hypothetical protein